MKIVLRSTTQEGVSLPCRLRPNGRKETLDNAGSSAAKGHFNQFVLSKNENAKDRRLPAFSGISVDDRRTLLTATPPLASLPCPSLELITSITSVPGKILPRMFHNLICTQGVIMKKLIFLSLFLFMIAFSAANTYTIGTGTSSTSYSPYYGSYDYSWNKIIYTSAEINTAGLTGATNIYGFGFYAYNTPMNYLMLDQKVYVRHTTLDSYGTATDDTGTGYPAASGFTQVFDANIVYNGIGWYYVMFNAPFAWNGTGNLEILWENWDGDYYTGYPTHTYTATGSIYRTVYKYADNTYPTAAGTRTYNRPNLRIVTQTLDPAPIANLASPADGTIALTDAILSWNNSQGMASSYDIYLGTNSNPPLLTNTTDMTYSPTLAYGQTYYWKIVPRNANGTGTSSSIWSFNTPRENQLVESFENTNFPPPGWGNPGGFTRSTTTPYHLTAGAYKSTAAPATLFTPMLEITESSIISFWARAGVSTGIGRIQTKYSDDGTNWNTISDLISLPANTNWNNYIVDLSSLAGTTTYIGFEVYSSTTTATGVYLDLIEGPDVAALPPDPAIPVYPQDNGWTLTDATLSWAASATGGIPNSYDVYFGTTATPDLVSSQTAPTYTPVLASETTYYWQIVPRNGTGSAENCPIWSFHTPGASQLVESFENSTFPPIGWANPGTWSRNTTLPFHGTASAYKSASTIPAILSTPLLAINGSSVLDFYYRTSATTGYGLLNIKYSTDRVTWNLIGSTISMPVTTEWIHASRNLSAITPGNYYLGFEVLTTTSTAGIYLDHVFGPNLAAIVPGAATPTAPSNSATGVAKFPAFTWTLPTTGGVPSGYRIYCDTNSNPTTLLGTVTNPYAVTWTSTTALNYLTTYYWKVVAFNSTGESTGNTVFSFTTIPDPTIYTMPWLEDFGTTGATFPPANWTRWSGALANPSILTSGSTVWGQDNWVNDAVVTPINWSARMNIYSTARQHWIITPPIQIPGPGYQLECDIALTDYNAAAPITADVNGTTGVDDKFIILIGDGSTWTPANILRQYDNAGSPYVYNNISYTGDHLIFPLDAYTGIKYIAFYGESTVSNADNDFFVDNVMIRQTPAGAPEHVTLETPVDGAPGVDPNNAILSWAASLTGGNPAYYEVYVGADPIDPSTSYYGEYFYESTGTSFNLSAQTDIDLGYNTTWYWAVLPFNSGGLSPDPLDHNFMVFDFTTLPDPTITSLPHNEYFDTVTAPALPWGWSSYINSTVTTGYVNTYNSSSYAVSTPNSVRLYNSTDTAATVMLITPDFTTPLRNIKVRFYARTSTAGDNLLVGSVDPTTHVFTQVGVISALTTTHTQYEVLFTSYVGTDTFIAFKHGGGTSSRTIYIDNVEFIELVDNDLAATAITGPGYGIVGTPLQFDITVKNEGLLTQNAYNIHLKRYGDDRLASMPITTPIAPGATATYSISWTPTSPYQGVLNLVGEVELTGDATPGNNETATKTVYAAPASVSILSVGDDASTTSGYYLPLDMYHKNSVTEQLYFTDELHLNSGSITAIIYKNTFQTNLSNKPVKIWMAHTTVTDLTGGWLPAANYALVFDGTVNFPSGVNSIVIPLNTPYAFTGGTLAVRVNRPMDTVYYSTSDKFYYTTTAAHTNRGRYLVNDTTVYDPMAPSAAGTAVGYTANTRFIVDNAVLQQSAVLSGHVYQGATTTPIAGATVNLTERLTATTDTNGFYQFTFWADTNVDVTAAMTNYYSQSFTNLALTMGNTVTQDFHLTPLPRVTVSGRVLANDAPAGLIGASVALNGTENQSMTTLADGLFSFANVLGSNAGISYTLTISKTGYTSYTAPVIVFEATVALGDITLNEHAWTAYNLVATHSGDNVQLAWDPAAQPAYYFSDFETDNGGWVRSSNWTGTSLPNYPDGDWQWTNTYNVANYNTTGGSSPQTPPTTAHSGTGLWGTVIYGPYTNLTVSGQRSFLRKTFDLSVFTNPVISLWHHMDGYNTYDYGQIKVNGTAVWGTSAAAVFMPWQQLTVDLSAYAGLTNAEISFEWSSTTVSNYAGWYIDDIYVGPATTRESLTQLGSANAGRSLQNFDVYRLLAADAATPANWTLLNGAVNGTTYLDSGFAPLPTDKYKWAVKANYTGSLESAAILSNSLGRVYDPQDITATTVGSSVVLSWTAQAGADFYKVYAADDPYGTFTYLGYSASPTYTVTTPGAKKFYKVYAATDEALPSPADRSK